MLIIFMKIILMQRFIELLCPLHVLAILLLFFYYDSIVLILSVVFLYAIICYEVGIDS